jgi:hypothetical protein
MKAAAALVSVGLLAAASAQASSVRSGLYGGVTRGPISPVCVAEQPCDEPAAGAVLVFMHDGREVVRTKARGDGSYRVRMPAGVYVVRSGRRIEPAKVRVLRGHVIRVNFSIDTGIR